MNRKTLATILFPVTLSASLATAQPASKGDITNAERASALRYLETSRKGVLEAVKGLSPAQLNFKPAPDRWSVAEVVEHLALIEDLILHGIFGQFSSAPAPSADHNPKQVDELILEKVPDRTTKLQAPPPAVPTGRWTPEATLERFTAGSAELMALLKSRDDLRAHVIAHPALGPLDGYEWIIATAAHTERHTKQILEVKADPQFPKK